MRPIHSIRMVALAAAALVGGAAEVAAANPHVVVFQNCTSQLALLPVAPAIVDPILPPGFSSDGFVYSHAIRCQKIRVGETEIPDASTKWFTAGVVPPAHLGGDGVDNYLLPLIGVSPQPSLADAVRQCGLGHIRHGVVTIAQDLESTAAHAWEAEADAEGGEFSIRTAAASAGGAPGLDRTLRFFGTDDAGSVAGFMTVRLPVDPVGLGGAVTHVEGVDSPLGDATLAGAVVHATGLTIQGTCQTL